MIGNGNVALDVARVLAKRADEMARSDIVPEAGAAIAAAPLADIMSVGRRGPEHASFTGNELAEMGRLSRAVSVADPATARSRRRRAIRRPRGCARPRTSRSAEGFAERSRQQAGHRAFHLQPTGRAAIEPGDLDLVVTCIGYGVEFPKGEGVFPVGWAKRGPSDHPDQPGRQPCCGPAGDRLAEGARSQERARSVAAVGRPRGLAPHRQGRGRGRRRTRPPAREIDGLAGAAGHRRGADRAISLLPAAD